MQESGTKNMRPGKNADEPGDLLPQGINLPRDDEFPPKNAGDTPFQQNQNGQKAQPQGHIAVNHRKKSSALHSENQQENSSLYRTRPTAQEIFARISELLPSRFSPRWALAGVLTVLFLIALASPDACLRAFQTLAASAGAFLEPVLNTISNIFAGVSAWLSHTVVLGNCILLLGIVLLAREMLVSHRLARTVLLTAASIASCVLVLNWLASLWKNAFPATGFYRIALLAVLALVLVGTWYVIWRTVRSYFSDLPASGHRTSAFEAMFLQESRPAPAQPAPSTAQTPDPTDRSRLSTLLVFAGVTCAIAALDLLVFSRLPAGALEQKSVFEKLAAQPGRIAVLFTPVVLAALVITLLRWNRSKGRCTLLTFSVFFQLLLLEASVVGANGMHFETGVAVLDILLNLLFCGALLIAVHLLLKVILCTILDGRLPSVALSREQSEMLHKTPGALVMLRMAIIGACRELVRVLVVVIRSLWVMFFTADMLDDPNDTPSSSATPNGPSTPLSFSSLPFGNNVSLSPSSSSRTRSYSPRTRQTASSDDEGGTSGPPDDDFAAQPAMVTEDPVSKLGTALSLEQLAQFKQLLDEQMEAEN